MIRLTRQQAREVDRLAIEVYGVPGIVLMENAALGAVAVAEQMLLNARGPAVILCGGGNNGGDGLAVARHLHNRGHDVEVLLCTDPGAFKGDARINWRIVETMRMAWRPLQGKNESLEDAGLVIDAIFGTGLAAEPRPPFPDIAAAVERAARPVLAIDVPSGLDCDTGLPLGAACIKAESTVTFIAEKAGFANPQSVRYTGHVTVADIGCPREIIDEVLGTA